MALMMALLLTGCGKAAEERLEENREKLAAAERIAFTAALRADLGREEFCCVLEAERTPDGTSLTITEPEELAGITARLLPEGEGLLEYDGVSLSLGSALTDGPGPLQCMPLLFDALREGHVVRAWTERDGETELLAAELWVVDDLGLTVWFRAADLTPVHAGFTRDGQEFLRCELSGFSAGT